ncbi:hypothetical protein AB0M58_13415 [Streptomyces bobili]|uniref:hypothetical protein n=1 Tax=Streptomyces bobili TaxID=67280 RepID=UPI003422A6C3
MSAARFEILGAAGTGPVCRSIRLGDGHTLSVAPPSRADLVPVVYLWPGLEAPDTGEWESEDLAEASLSGVDGIGGREFCDVPLQALRDLIEQHGGEVTAADGDEVVTAPLAQLRAAGVLCYPWGGDSAGQYAEVPLADGTRITFSGTSVGPDGKRGTDVSTRHLVAEHGSWQACWDNHGASTVDLYDSYGEARAYEEDTTALVAAILQRVLQSGGSAPEEGAGKTAGQLATEALADRGVVVHPVKDAVDGDAWLVIGTATGAVPDMDHEPYILLSLYNDSDGEWVVDRPPVRPGDEWQVVTGDGTGTEETLTARPVGQLPDCVEAIVGWIAKLQA